jgi:hypothetical protein
MNVLTHIGISLRLRNAIKRSMDVKLSTLGFIWGNVKPDLISRQRKIPHFKKDADLYFRTEVKRIINKRIYENEKCPVDFSVHLGTITHYLSDFFCHAHSENFKGGFFKHNLYEAWLNLHCAVHSGRIVQEHENADVIFYNSNAICNRIDKLQYKYLKSKKSARPETDLNYLYKACMMLSRSIIASCLVGVEAVAIPQLSVFTP